MKLIRNTLCPHWLSSGRIRNASETVDGIKLKHSAYVEGDVEETKVRRLKKQRCYAHTSTNAATTIAIVQSKGIKVKLLRNI